jgi:hypothetical protein
MENNIKDLFKAENNIKDLFKAVWEGTVEDMGKIMEKAHMDPNVMGDFLAESGVAIFNWTPLTIAAHRGKAECITALIKKGADPNKMNDNGYTPLHLASREGHKMCVEALLKNGADLEIVNNGKNALHIATEEGKRDSVVMLLAYGAEVNALHNGRQTALHIAMRKDSFRDKTKIEADKEIIEVLLKAGADPTLKGGERNMHTGWSGSDDQLVAHMKKTKTELHDAQKLEDAQKRLLLQKSINIPSDVLEMIAKQFSRKAYDPAEQERKWKLENRK